ncbi:MAG: hypothetical protein KJ064_16455 [Anaerolineae bacterium]|nr:hypothetical protein [Anaerolineae bacterium]
MTSRRYLIASLMPCMLLLLLFLTLLTRPAQALDTRIRTTFEPYGPENPLPMVVLIEYDPWRMVIGSDSPTFALYQNGQVIYIRENEDGDMEYASVFLNFEERQTLYDTIVSDDFFELDDYYEASHWTDMPSNWMWVWDEKGKEKRVGVYGDLRSLEGILDEEPRSRTPEAFLQAFDTIVSFTHEDAKTWRPAVFEVMLWPYDTSDGAAWPENWPDLDDPTTKQRGEDSYSIFVDSAELDTYFALREEGSAVELDGRRWAFSMRFPFPTEFLWMGE